MSISRPGLTSSHAGLSPAPAAPPATTSGVGHQMAAALAAYNDGQPPVDEPPTNRIAEQDMAQMIEVLKEDKAECGIIAGATRDPDGRLHAGLLFVEKDGTGQFQPILRHVERAGQEAMVPLVFDDDELTDPTPLHKAIEGLTGQSLEELLSNQNDVAAGVKSLTGSEACNAIRNLPINKGPGL